MRTSRSGFTRTELLITVMILGVLAAVGTPQFADAPMPRPTIRKVAAGEPAPRIIGAYP